MKIIDLSVPLNENTPVYPGDPKVETKPAGVLEKDGYNDCIITMGNHNGTHVDAPIHMIEGGKTLADLDISNFAGRGVYIKLRDKKFDLEQVRSAGIKADDIVLFHTGMSDVYNDAKTYYEEYPGIPEDIANYLVEQKVKMVGVDMCSVDHEPFAVHKILLGGNVLIIENLTNLTELEGKEFEVFALPIKLEVDGAPARVIAKL
jgi:arylformamidase